LGGIIRHLWKGGDNFQELVSCQVYNVALYLYQYIQFEGIEHEKIHRNTF